MSLPYSMIVSDLTGLVFPSPRLRSLVTKLGIAKHSPQFTGRLSEESQRQRTAVGLSYTNMHGLRHGYKSPFTQDISLMSLKRMSTACAAHGVYRMLGYLRGATMVSQSAMSVSRQFRYHAPEPGLTSAQ